MRIFDRYKGCETDEQHLSEKIETGRYVVIGDDGGELTYRFADKVPNQDILQGILSDKMQAMQALMRTFFKKASCCNKDEFTVWPIVQGLDQSIVMSDFEKFLYKNLFHIKEIFRTPYSMLHHVTTKMNASRAKRIPARSYDYLSSHTEDWLEKTITTFKPLRVLSEELEQDYDVYENRLAVATIEFCISHVEKRLQELKDANVFIESYKSSLERFNSEKSWHARAYRTLDLAGKVYSDMDANFKDGTHTANKRHETIDFSIRTLKNIKSELIKLRGSDLYDAVNKKSLHSIKWRPTNVTVNHKHYKYLRPIWKGLMQNEQEKSKIQLIEEDEQTLAGMRAYAMSLIVYCIQNVAPNYNQYSIKGSYLHFEANHNLYTPIDVLMDGNGIIQMNIGSQKIHIVVIGSRNGANSEELRIDNTYVIAVTPYTGKSGSHVIEVYPYDLDSIERVGSFLRKYILIEYVNRLYEPFKVSKTVWNFKDDLGTTFLKWNESAHTASFQGYPEFIDETKAMRRLLSDNRYLSITNHVRMREISDAFKTVVNDLNAKSEEAREKRFFCFQCCNPIDQKAFSSINYITCPNCGFTIDSTDHNCIRLLNKDTKYRSLKPEDWGQDYIIADTKE